MNKFITAMGLCVVLPVLAAAAQTEMTYEQYETALAQAQQRETAAKEQIAQEQAGIEALRQQLSEMDQRIAAAAQERYTALGAGEQDASAAENEAASIKQELESLLNVMPEDLLKRGADIIKLEARIGELKVRPVMKLWKLAPLVSELESLLAQVKARVPVAQSSPTYTVQRNPQRRDCLYRIAANQDAYSDASQWPRIYRANQGLIDGAYEKYRKNQAEPKYSRAEDLIFPGQVLDIPR